MQHHDDKTSVHITLNKQTVPHRKGVGNMPFVFRAYGTAHLDPSHSPPDASSSTPAPGVGSTPPPSLHPLRIFPAYKRPATGPPQRAQPETAGEGDTDIDGFSSDEDDFDGGLDTRVWNHTGAFPRFLSLVRARARTSSSSSSSSSSSRSRSHSPSPLAPLSPSSPARSSSPSLVGTHGMRRGLEADVAEGRVQEQSKKGVKADVRKDKARSQKDRARARARATRSTTEEVWNPFAHLTKDV